MLNRLGLNLQAEGDPRGGVACFSRAHELFRADKGEPSEICASLENLAGMMKSSITELQGMMGGEMGQSMQQLRQSAAGGEGQMRATLDLAKEMGSGISRQQEMRKARGAMLFQEYKKKMGMVQPEVAAAAQATPKPTEKQKIAE